MVKILSQSGNSLADVYDVQGSIAGIEDLQSREVSLVHEMGGTILSERLSSVIKRATTGAINQDTSWEVKLNDMPVGIFRVLNVFVMADTAARVQHAQVSMRDNAGGREIPIFVWSAANDVETNVRIQDDDATVTVQLGLMPTRGYTVVELGVKGIRQPQQVGDMVFRGKTEGFGAGTVTVVALMHLAFTDVGGLSSRGLPVPSW